MKRTLKSILATALCTVEQAFQALTLNGAFQQRYPWNGLVDVSCDLMGAGKVTLGATVLTNGVRFIWNSAADLPAGFKAQGVQIKVKAEK